jgi:hypothetical protein
VVNKLIIDPAARERIRVALEALGRQEQTKNEERAQGSNRPLIMYLPESQRSGLRKKRMFRRGGWNPPRSANGVKSWRAPACAGCKGRKNSRGARDQRKQTRRPRRLLCVFVLSKLTFA